MKKLFVLLFFLAAPLHAADLESTFSAGETLDFDLTWLLITGGSMRMTIGPQPGDRTHFRITSVATSSASFARIFSVRDEIASFVDRDAFSTVGYEKHLNPNHDTEEISVVKPVFDPLSLVYHLRELDLSPGKVHRFNGFADGKLYTMEADVTGGLFRDEDSRLTIWYTDDARHLPIRIRSEVKVGTITAALRAVRAGVTSIQP